MRLNENVTLDGTRCLLVPYTRDLVETYHSWFVNDEELLELTGSELLSVEEEYINQESWRSDESKLTFLIRDKLLQLNPLCGDINAFFSDYFEDDWTEATVCESTPKASGLVAEINLMIADQQSRRKGIAREAITIFSNYITENVRNIRMFVAKIQMHNAGSIKLFESLGYSELKRVECFNEIHFIKRV